MKKILALTLTIIMTCTALGSCGETAQQSAESKAATTTTITTETTTETPAETEETTTTTTATETETTTTTEAAEETETETETEPQTEAPAENPEETGIVTYPDNEEGMYPMLECFRRKAEEYSGQKVISIDYNNEDNVYELTLSDDEKAFLTAPVNYLNELDNLYSINSFEIIEMKVKEYSFVVKM